MTDAAGVDRIDGVQLREALARPVLEVAPELLGARLVREGPGRRIGRIVEVEAYDGISDRASHARSGRTARNAVMFGPQGHAYVYLVYGMHHCLNVVTGPDGRAAAVLIRAVAPLEGLDEMREARLAAVLGTGRAGGGIPVAQAERIRTLPSARLAAGPGLVGATFGLDRGWSGTDLCDPISPLRLEPRPADEPVPAIVATARIGVAYAGEPWASRPWRFVVAGDPSVSRPVRDLATAIPRPPER